MTSTLSQHGKNLDSNDHSRLLEICTTNLYELKEKFESNYYGMGEFRKYEKARAFNIELNAVLFEVNKLLAATDTLMNSLTISKKGNANLSLNKNRAVSKETFVCLKAKIRKLEQELSALVK